MGQIQLLAQMTDEQMAGGIVAALIAFISGFAVLFGILGLFFMACYWKVFSKAGQPGWAAFVPILAFGSAEYQGPAALAGDAPAGSAPADAGGEPSDAGDPPAEG